MQLAVQHLAEVVEAIRKAEAAGNGNDKRRFARITIVTKVEILNPSNGRTYTALTRDLSLEGLGLIQSVPMTRGQQITVSLPRSAKHGPLAVQCTVMHIRELADGVWGIGALFVAVNETGKTTTADAGKEAERIAANMLK
jgi:hypothetical protein